MKIKNKVAIVTGGAKGIGRAISLDLLKQGVKVIINFFGDKENVKKFENELKEFSGNFKFVKADVSKMSEVEKIFKIANKEFGMVDILVNNAGVFTFDDLPTDKRYKKVFEINFFAQVYATEIFAKQFKGDLGKITNISSIYSSNPFCTTGGTRAPEYACSKSANDMFTKISAKNFDGKILVNSVNPGSTLTPMWNGTDEDFLKIRAQESLIKRFMKPEEISDAVLFVLKNDAMNGQHIIVDGGNTLN